MEWTTLVIFTLLSEAAVGLVLAYAVVGGGQGKLGKPVFLTSWVLTAAAIVVSLFHLGWPMSAYRVLGGLGSSWLSWEVVLTGCFGVGALALWWRSRTAAVSPVLSGLLALVGLAAVLTSGMIYSLPSVPANNNLFPPALFLATALATGSAVLLVILAATKHEAPAGPFIYLALGSLALAALVNVIYPTAAAGGLPEARRQAAAFTAGGWHVVRLLAGVLVPAGLLVWMARRPRAQMIAAALTVAALVVLSEAAGRSLFFNSTTFLTFGL